MENDMRKIKGKEIAETKVLTLTPKGWIVPSPTSTASYLVYKENGKNACTCKDYELRGCTCKHQYAVDFFVQKTTDAEGNTTITKTMRVTYPQNWSAYNEAQSNEIRLFDILLNGLVEGVDELPKKAGAGRPNLSQKESVFCSVQKVYSQLSQRRATTLYRNAEERKQISHAPHFNAVGKLLNKEGMTPTLIANLLNNGTFWA